MPEGDSIAVNASRLRPILEGKRVESVYGTAPSVRSRSSALVGREVTSVRNHGKNLVIDLSSGYSLRIHLGMNGRWVVTGVSGRPPGSAKLVLTTEDHHAACFGAPTVDVDRTAAVERALQALGPDLLGSDFDTAEFVRRIRLQGHLPVAEALLDQRVLAGIGNVYKSEVLFLERINPFTPSDLLTTSQLGGIADKARRLLVANVRAGRRTTTAERAPGRTTWVYARSSRPCRRCGTAIRQERQSGRLTFWCPVCQPDLST